MVLARVHPLPGSDCSDDMRGGGWRLDGGRRDDDDCDNLCEDVSELEAHTRLKESNWELSERTSSTTTTTTAWSTTPTPEGVGGQGNVPSLPRLHLFV